MKGQFIEFTFIGIIFTMSFLLITVFSIQYNIVRNVDFQYRYDSAQTTLLSLLSVTGSGNIPNIQNISEKIFFQNNPWIDLNLTNSTLYNFAFDSATGNICYLLKSSNSTILLFPSNCNPQYSAYTKIPLPYNPNNLVDTLTLVRN